MLKSKRLRMRHIEDANTELVFGKHFVDFGSSVHDETANCYTKLDVDNKNGMGMIMSAIFLLKVSAERGDFSVISTCDQKIIQ